MRSPLVPERLFARSFSESDSKAMLNILEDFASEKARLHDTERALQNILEDLAEEKMRLEETQQALLRSEQAIRLSLKEKELLLKEIHHRVKNNLQIVQSLLDLQGAQTKESQAALAMRDCQSRINSMALIHQTLYQSDDLAKVNLGHFVDALMAHLHNSYCRPDIRLHAKTESIQLSIDRAIPCGLIINELVVNSLKHAFPDGRRGNISVEARKLNESEVEVAVIDDGIGIPDQLDLDALPSLGMQLIRVLTDQLHARLDVQRHSPVRIAFTFSQG